MLQPDNLYCLFYQSPLGCLKIAANETGITCVWFVEVPDGPDRPDVLTRETQRQLQAYFDKKLRRFDLPLSLRGTDFQQQVWTALTGISFGKTRSYMDIARRLGDEKAIRAVGRANGENPVGIIVPCHRVIGSDGSLTGYAGGIWRKKWLLQHEGAWPQMELAF
jgi:methylated-DNA-[protein]-cysteine S-methyltransferase